MSLSQRTLSELSPFRRSSSSPPSLWAIESGSWRHFSASLFAYVVVPNLIMRVVAHRLLGTWQPINVDYALAAIVGGAFGLWATVTVVAGAFLVDAFTTMS